MPRSATSTSLPQPGPPHPSSTSLMNPSSGGMMGLPSRTRNLFSAMVSGQPPHNCQSTNAEHMRAAANGLGHFHAMQHMHHGNKTRRAEKEPRISREMTRIIPDRCGHRETRERKRNQDRMGK